MTEQNIYEELIEATGVKPKKGEDSQAYAKRLAMSVDKMAEDDWHALTEPAQLWGNEAVAAADAGKEIILTPGMPGSEGEDVDESDDDEEEAARANSASDRRADDDVLEEEEEPVKRTVKAVKAGTKANGAATKKGRDVDPELSVQDEKSVDKPAKKAQSKPAKVTSAKPEKSAKPKPVKSVPVDKPAKKAQSKPAKASKPEKKAVTKKREVSAEARPGTKRAKLLEMLHRKQGATVKEICDAFEWVSHTARGAISLQVRKAGYNVVSEKNDKRGHVYRIEAGA